LLFTVKKTYIHDLMNPAKSHEANEAVIHTLQVRNLQAIEDESFSPGW
jgi:hypothetical protein